MQEHIELRILRIRGLNVLLDSDLAELYGVETKRLNEQVKRNKDRFPADFVFQLNREEARALRSHLATSKGRGGRRYAPYVFTEHGALMAANVLNSKRAIEVSVHIVRAFVKLREVLATHDEPRHKLLQLEQKYDEQFKVVFDAIRKLIEIPPQEVRTIGFKK